MDFAELRHRSQWEAAATQFCRRSVPVELIFEAMLAPLHQRLASDLEVRRQQRASYVLLHVYRRCPQLLPQQGMVLLPLLERSAFAKTHPSVPRQLFSIWQSEKFSEDDAGQVFAKAVDFFLDSTKAVAVRARALDCAANVARQYPGLWPEVQVLAESIEEEESVGLRSVGRRILRDRANSML